PPQVGQDNLQTTPEFPLDKVRHFWHTASLNLQANGFLWLRPGASGGRLGSRVVGGVDWGKHMRQRGIGTWLLAICLGWGMAAFARADDDGPAKPSGNWFTRVFRRQPAA